DPGRFLHQAEDRQGGHALAAARLAHDAEGFARIEVEADTVDRPHHAVVGEKLRLQVLDLEDGLAHRFCLGSRASRKPSPRKLNAIRVSESAIAGASTMWGEMRMAWKPSAAIAPQDGVGGGTPR